MMITMMMVIIILISSRLHWPMPHGWSSTLPRWALFCPITATPSSHVNTGPFSTPPNAAGKGYRPPSGAIRPPLRGEGKGSRPPTATGANPPFKAPFGGGGKGFTPFAPTGGVSPPYGSTCMIGAGTSSGRRGLGSSGCRDRVPCLPLNHVLGVVIVVRSMMMMMMRRRRRRRTREEADEDDDNDDNHTHRRPARVDEMMDVMDVMMMMMMMEVMLRQPPGREGPAPPLKTRKVRGQGLHPRLRRDGR
jgi:hypothetical protein